MLHKVGPRKPSETDNRGPGTDMTVPDELIASAPSVGTEKPVQLRDLEPAMAAAGVSPSDALAVSWCRFSMHNIEALTEGTTLAIIR